MNYPSAVAAPSVYLVANDGHDVRELSIEEIDQVSGGVAPLVVAGVAVGGFVLGVAVGFGLIYMTNQLR
jgi:lactobin A/cerein 7B family class IIb bacteriocin